MDKSVAVVGSTIGNRPANTPITPVGTPLRWQNVDNGVYRSPGPNTGYRYGGDGFTGARYPGDELASINGGEDVDSEVLMRAVRRVG